MGEIRTCLLRTTSAVPKTAAADLLALIPGEKVRLSDRPIAQAVSPEVVTGVDCRLPAVSGAKYRGVGTLAARAVVTGGRVLQGSVFTRIAPAPADRRLPWSHYLARPGVIETIGKAKFEEIAEGFMLESQRDGTLDTGAVSERLIGEIQASPLLDRTVPFRTRRTRLRWAARIGSADGLWKGAEFTVEDETLRTLALQLPEIDVRGVIGFCEDLALHDWILTTILTLAERAGLDTAAGTEAVERLRPAITHLMHLWMPGAHVTPELDELWESLERRPGFTRQWQSIVARIRDQLALHTLSALGNATGSMGIR